VDNLGRSQRIALRIAGVVAGLSFLVALPLILSAGFHADDFLLFPREGQPWSTAVAAYLCGHDPEAVHYYRPGCRIVQQTLQSAFGTSQIVFHGWNILLHLAAVYVLYRLARSLVGDKLIAGMAAVIFLIHPAHDEPVMWITGISGLTDSLFHLVGLLAFDTFLKSRKPWTGWMVVVSFLLALSHKESATSMLVTLPLLWWYRGHKKEHLWPLVGVALSTVGLALWRSVIGVESSLAWQNLSFNPLTWIRNVMFYLAQFLAPVRSLFRMIGFENYYALRDALPVVPGSVAYMVGIGLVAILSLILGRRLWARMPREAKLGVGLAILAIAPLLVSRYTGLRLLYLSSAFLALALAAVIGWRRNCRIMNWVAAAWVIAMSVSWVERATAWNEAGKINEVILSEAVRVRKHTPDNTASVYLDVPRRHIGAFLFPGAFAEAVRWRMQMQPGLIFDYDDPYTDRTQIPAARMWYRWNGSRFEEVTEPTARPVVDP
jgi:hypothetical protein